MTIRTMIVDDSATVRQVLAQVLNAHPDIEVTATAPDPLFALQKMQGDWPDVLVVDVEMPRMDGITFVRKLMSERPTPVVICSTLTQKGTELAVEAMASGAFAVVAKPKLGLQEFLRADDGGLVDAVRAASRANLRLLAPGSGRPLRAAVSVPEARSRPDIDTTDRVVAIGISTGGTRALEDLLGDMPRTACGMIIVQHMPEQFTGSFARRLDGLCRIQVREAQDGDRVLPGLALIAPGGRHLRLQRSGAQYRVVLDADGPRVSYHKPSVDVLFQSVAQHAGRNALGVIMTGMGRDGVDGLMAMRKAGAMTIAQDETTSVVFGMPRMAIECGAASKVLPLSQIGVAISKW